MVDDDMNRFNPQDIPKLFHADKPIISGMCLKRGFPYQAVHRFDGQSPELISEHFKLGEPQPVEFCGTAFTLIKREVFESIREETDKEPLWFTMDREERPEFKDEINKFLDSHRDNITQSDLMTAIIMGQQSHRGTTLVGEDFNFCKSAAKLGYDSWVHYGVPVGHIGEFTFDPRSTMHECTTD